MKKNLLIVHGGGPTPVINMSLYGVIQTARACPEIGTVYGAVGGTAGLLSETFVDFSTVSSRRLELLRQTPSSAIGTSRTHLRDEDYAGMVSIFQRHNIGYVLFNGGNGSMDTCGKIYKAAKESGIAVIGIPKTVDNDIAVTDHCPGFGSAARYLAQTVAEIAADVRSLPIHVSVVEAMGRNAGWITGSAALARSEDAFGPHILLLPEVPFEEGKFLAKVEKLVKSYGSGVVVVSEGIKYANGTPVVEPIFQSGRSVYYGDVSLHLAKVIIQNLGYKARSEKSGLAARASIGLRSEVDMEEARQAGEMAVKAAVSGKTGVMAGLKRISTSPYLCEPVLIPIEDVMLTEKMLPEHFIDRVENDVTPAFVEWCRPLIGGPLTEFTWLG